MLAQRFLNLVGSLFLFLDGKYLVEKKSDCLVLDRFTYANITPGMLTTGKVNTPGCFYSDSFFWNLFKASENLQA